MQNMSDSREMREGINRIIMSDYVKTLFDMRYHVPVPCMSNIFQYASIFLAGYFSYERGRRTDDNAQK